MTDQLTAKEKTARRAAGSCQNAPKNASQTRSRGIGLKDTAETATIDLAAGAGLTLLTSESPAAYAEMTAEYQRTVGPTNRVEASIVQRIVDAQWRLLRITRLQTLEIESGFEEVRQIDHPGLPDCGVALADALGANRVADDAKYIRRLEREETRLLRVIKMTYSELKELRKLNPLPVPPVRHRIECIGEPAAIMTETHQALARQASAEESTPAAETTQPVEKAEVVPPSPNDRSQLAPELPHYPKPLGLWLAQPTKPKTFAAGTGGLYGELEPV
ncbi:MAG: hypothetical protein NTX13_06050 [Acidobacteria bacterium]|nr:hypothetical protein [Acidobacteriota bacterium]